MLREDCTPNEDHGTEENHWSVLEQIAREGARRLLQQAMENEEEEYLESQQSFRDEQGHQVVVRNGYMRRVPSVDNLIPVRYLKGISTGDFSEALVSIPGEGVRGGISHEYCTAEAEL